MPKFVTPARLAAAVGVLTGLAAAATALAGALPLGATQNAVVAAAGVLGQAIVLFKFLEGQASWEATPVGQAQALGTDKPLKLVERPAASPFIAAATAAAEAADAEEGSVVDAQVDTNYAPESAGAPSQ